MKLRYTKMKHGSAHSKSNYVKISIYFFLCFINATTLTGQVINVTDYGATPNNESDNDRDAILIAIEACRDQKNPTLFFPEGLYHLNSSGQSGTYFYINGIDNLTIDGGGSTLKVLGNNYSPHLFEFVQCKSLTVKNIKVDYQDPPFSQGKIISASGSHMLVKIFDGFTTEGKEIEAYAQYDSLTRQMANSNERYGNTPWQWEDESNNVIRINSNSNGYAANSYILLRHTLYTGYTFITSTGCQDVVYDGIIVHVSPGYAFLGNNGAENISHLNCRIEAKEGFWVTTNADGSHNLDVRGELIFDKCYFEHMSDDGINLHGYFLDVINKIDDNTIDVKCENPTWYRAVGYKVGDEVEFIDKNTLESLGYHLISNISNKNGSSMRLQFEDAIPVDANSVGNYKVANVSMVGKLSVTNSTIRANRARGILVSASDVLIEDCTFERNLMFGIFFDVSTYWNESRIGKNVVIRNNTFDDSGYFRSGTEYGVINFHPEINSPNVQCDIFKNISITGNTFKNNRIPAIYAQNVDGLVITDNIIESAKPSRNLIRHTYCKEPVIENNTGAQIDDLGGFCTDIIACHDVPGRIEAENYHDMSGLQTAVTPDTGGGYYLGWINSSDWVMYEVCVETNDKYMLDFRLASESQAGNFEIYNQNSDLLGTVTTPATGSWRKYTTVSQSIKLTTEDTALKFVFTGGTFDLNWINISVDTTTILKSNHYADLKLYPNPTNNELNVSGNIPLNGELSIYDLSGRKVYTKSINTRSTNFHFNLDAGFYLVQIRDENGVIKTQLIRNN